MAAYYGDYPELAAVRMVWARTVAEGLRHQPSVSHPSAQRRNQRARLAA